MLKNTRVVSVALFVLCDSSPPIVLSTFGETSVFSMIVESG